MRLPCCVVESLPVLTKIISASSHRSSRSRVFTLVATTSIARANHVCAS